MTGVVIGKDENAFSWVYDCGSKSSNAMGSALARTASWSVWPDRINMLVLSHFDDDHVNGLEDLLKQCEVDFLILPFSEWQQRVRDVAVGGLKGISASTAQLQLSPITWLQSKDLTAKVGTLLLVRGGSSEQQEDREPMRLPTGTNPNELGGDRQRQDSLEQRELRMVASTHVAGPTVQVMQHGTPVHPDGFPMEFMFYNAEVSGKDLDIIKTAHTGDLISKRSRLPLHEVRKEIEAEISALGLDMPLSSWPLGWRAKLKKCYESHFGSSSAAKNNISLCMYAAPRLDAQELDLCALFQEHDTPPDVDAGYSFCSDRPAVLCTGDLRIDANVISTMQSHFNRIRWNRIGITQVPHHGSEHSWVSGNAKSLAPSAFVHCAPGKGAHPHASVVTDLIGHTVFTADYKSSVGLKYHFLVP
ncbi:hypothetical protein DZC30_02555 [Comamonas testosteroni]|uniref:Metallo-beta-lactamase domain-containing protein n=1 Tax=Comamonas testosteroni TaxID=285 RepID=A0A373FT82_COMTE|nr:hypothetical protein [Comamonas testosteroni]RGE46675.1 hypothetical protein DZC30_02555 [Comamonas testosteroni]